MVDLHRWLEGSYAIPVMHEADELAEAGVEASEIEQWLEDHLD